MVDVGPPGGQGAIVQHSPPSPAQPIQAAPGTPFSDRAHAPARGNTAASLPEPGGSGTEHGQHQADQKTADKGTQKGTGRRSENGGEKNPWSLSAGDFSRFRGRAGARAGGGRGGGFPGGSHSRPFPSIRGL